MSLRQAIVLCSSLPLVGCIMRSLLELLSDSDESTSTNTDSMQSTMLADDKDDLAAVNNAAAQKHFSQIQHIRGA
ncbi:hypothetical protein Tsubulata_010372 [Turnera subulata]|uniref:Secreted protein n=1 Tax=Turnera subulata TaxID=218843 RepID=A0A9Q0G0D1_9ROSI|nr:hypothetical protein Tsubulata_010372 [Turnera subulata]